MARVLLVDDEKSIRLTLQMFLQQDGHEVEVAADAETALEHLRGSGPFDVLLSDILLPGMTGVELLRRTHESAPETQVVMMTGEPGVATATEALRAGAFDYLCKPITKTAVLKAVANAAQVKQLADDARRLEAENQAHQRNLERLVAERTQSLAAANAKLEQTLAELRETQKQMVQQERLRALGQMASGIAHDFNNKLGVIQGFSEILLRNPRKMADQAKVKRCLEMIHTAAKDGTTVVDRMREFYRQRQDESLEPVALNAVVEKTVSLTEPRWKDQAQANGAFIKIEKQLGEIPTVRANAAELREVLTNLIINAADAITGEGRIAIATRVAGDRVMLEVRDTGGGMDGETLANCTQPFYTTKGDDGTGLGLAVCDATIRRYDGAVAVESKVGGGTCVRISLPRYQGSREAPAKVMTVQSCGKLRVLVVDNEAPSRLLVAEYLSSAGHTADTASDGEEALQKYRAAPHDLVITDRAMPGMSGDQLAVALKREAAELPVIMLTGFGRMMASEDERPEGVDVLLGKPVSLDGLLAAVAQAGGGDQ